MVNPKIKIVLSILVLLILVYIVNSLFFRHLFWELVLGTSGCKHFNRISLRNILFEISKRNSSLIELNGNFNHM